MLIVFSGMDGAGKKYTNFPIYANIFILKRFLLQSIGQEGAIHQDLSY